MSDTTLRKALESFDGSKIIIRPSAIDGYFNCPRQWALTFLGDQPTIPGARAAIGTAIHAGVENEWKKAMASGQKDFNLTAMQDCAIDELQELDKQGLQYDANENLSTAESTVVDGTVAFVDDIVPFTEIPDAVEERYTIDLEHPVVNAVSGTVDYISKNAIADVKTSKRKPVPSSYATQQSVYKMLAEANGRTVEHSLIQGVVLKKVPDGHIMELEPKVDQAKYMLNSMLDTLEVFNEQKVAPEVMFRGNPKYYLCSEKYCAAHSICPYVQGTAMQEQTKVKL